MCLHAQYSNKELFAAYLANDMTVWDRYLHEVQWDSLPVAEKERYINYEYGYVATAIDTKQPDAKQHTEVFKQHIDAMEAFLPKATITTYLSSYAAYRAKLSTLDFIAQGLKAKSLAQDAAEIDPTNPLALTLVGCVDFYAPAIVGGNKQRALQAFQRAVQIFEQTGDTIDNWNYVSAQIQLVMCLDKTGQSQSSIRYCEQILQRYPDCRFLRDEYLPMLKGTAKKP